MQNEWVDVAFVRKNRNWARKHKRQKGLLNPWKWGYASRSRGSRSSGTKNVNQAADAIRSMFKEVG